MGKKHDHNIYSDFANVETQKNFLTSEEFPEGSYGSDGYNLKDEPVENKSTPWGEGQRFYTPFNYEYKTFHQNLPRKFPQAHKTHDNPDRETEPPYEDYTPE